MTSSLEEMAVKRFGPQSAQDMEEAIEAVGGREVFFAGSLDTEGLVSTVRVLARGHESATPAVFEGLKTGEVVIHNHPSGMLAPSEADLELASVYGFNGHGVYIVDNEITQVYVVVEPPSDDSYRLDAAELAEYLGPESAVAKHLDEYEVRPQQAQMIEGVVDAFNRQGISVIEAPTGVGKTLAYLLPVVKWAVHNRERVVVSTRTINLQEQIIDKDIPLLQRCMSERFQAVLVKGRGNYVCPSRLERALSESALFDEEADQEMLKSIAEWAGHTEDGSLADLPFVPPREVWEQVCSETDTCTTKQCTAAGNCFLTKARRKMAKADILVVNHHMLFSDLAIKRELGSFNSLAVLPSYRRVIWDEAHSIEDSATNYFGREATRNGALSLLGRFIQARGGRERGLLPYLKVKLIGEAKNVTQDRMDRLLDLIDNSLQVAIASAREALTAAFGALQSWTAERCGQIGRDIKWRLTAEILRDPELREIHTVYVLSACEELTACANFANALLRELKSVQETEANRAQFLAIEVAQLQSYRDRLERLSATLAAATSETLDPNTVRWIEIDGKNDRIVRLVTCPLDVGKPLAEWVYSNLKTVVMTSATLSVGRKFDYLFGRIGLDRMGDREVKGMLLDSPFDFARQALVCIAKDMAAPQEAAFLEETADYVRDVLLVTKGHAFLLFTSFYALDHVHKAVEKDLRKNGITPLKQGSASRTHLLDKFRKDISSVLFATDSFWEGVDVAGEALQCVILPRLPFRVPTEPIQQARSEAIEAGGGNAFMEYTVPQAVIRFRQGFGRLIRRKSDRGAVVVLDSRVLSKEYGKMFLDSLPKMRVLSGPRRGILQGLEKFFQGEAD